MNIKKVLKWGAIAAVALFVLIQLVPYGRNHTNPPVQSEPNWDSPETRALAETACFDCHSNETDWSRWYESVAPASWLVQHDVDEGRQRLNFSEWDQGGQPHDMGDLWEVLQRGQMPPSQYLLLHSEAKLTPAEIEQLIAGFKATVGN
ncbi:MAG: heme-binding domain-containing protein [Ardenticatenaceae bacterium]|nr:heme-binding domain-containing protein [Ardenticatenaceae bacterium]